MHIVRTFSSIVMSLSAVQEVPGSIPGSVDGIFVHVLSCVAFGGSRCTLLTQVMEVSTNSVQVPILNL